MTARLLDPFLAEGRRISAVARRYPVQTFGGMLTIVAVFMMILTGARYISGPLAGSQARQGSLVVGLVLWNLLMLSISEISSGIQSEAQIGTLEHLFLASQGLLKTMLLRACATEILFVAVNVVIASSIALVMHIDLSISPGIVIPLLGALLATNGIGLVLGAVALLSKRIGSAVQLMQFVLVSSVVIPFEQFVPERALRLMDLLPLIAASHALRDVMARGQALSLESAALILLNGTAYFAIGAFIFSRGQAVAHRRGALAGY
jgi:ABC-2 type transport system permease protein